MKEIGWLHFSDLHVGCKSYKWLWPTIKKYFFEDLQRQHERSGPWEFVVFSGDLTFSGIEYPELEEVLAEIWAYMNKMGSFPSLIPVPGNHDLNRPEKLSAVAKALEGWKSDTELRQHFWENDNNEYRQFIESRFSAFQAWIGNTAIPIPCLKKGLLPGDFSVSIQSKNGINFGLVGLNTSFLQLRDGMCTSTMSLHQRQIHELLGSEYSTWFESNDFTILLSHHDQEWLDSEGSNVYSSAINPPATFSVHLCGHVHESTSTHQSDSGSTPRLIFKAPALFGPEKWGEAHDRIHGYICGKFSLGENGEKFITIWPRKIVKKNAGHYKVDVDQGYDTTDESVTHHLKKSLNLDVMPISLTSVKPVGGVILPDDSFFSLEMLPHFPVYEEKHHLSVRLIEQKLFHEHLKAERCTWITADWGLGKDGFIRSLLSKFNVGDAPKITYYLHLPCDEVDSNEDLLQLIEEVCHISIQELCNRFSVNNLFLILDNVSPELAVGSNIVELERLLETILDYSPTFYIISTTRLRVLNSRYVNIILNPLDIPEVRTYVLNHPKCMQNELDTHFVDRVHSMSQGFPLYIDVFLKMLKVSSLEDIYDLEIDMSLQSMEQEEKIPRALKCAVSSLQNSSDDYTKRSFALLQVLSVLANGETFSKIKRFYNSKPFHLLNVTTLVDLSLLDAIPIRTQTKDISPKSLPDSGEHENNKLLRVPRQVRDYVRSLLSENEEVEINKVAADILFGNEWRHGKIKMSGTNFFKCHGIRPIEIGNEHTIAKTLISTAIKSHDSFLLNQAALLGRRYCSHLIKEDRFKDGMIASEELVHSLTNTDNKADLAQIKLSLANCLRMLGKPEEALRILHNLIDDFTQHLTKDELASIHLNIALIREKQGEKEEAINAAKKVQQLSEKGGSKYNQAASIIISLDQTHLNKSQTLKTLEAKSRKNNQYAVANNICLDLALKADKAEKLQLLDKVIACDGTDYYNRVRAIVSRVNCLASSGDILSITKADCHYISLSYSYLFSQRFSSLFNRCHEAIWNLLICDNQHDKLLKLFRHSSFLWRIRGDFEKEKEYLQKLQDVPANLLPQSTPEYHYLTSRLSSISTTTTPV